MSTRQYKIVRRHNTFHISSFIDGEQDRVSYALATKQHIPHGWYLHDLFVHEDHRRQGIGKRLVRLMQRSIKEAGDSSIYLMPAGERAHEIKKMAGWYRKLGFKKTQRFAEGGWIMRWEATKPGE